MLFRVHFTVTILGLHEVEEWLVVIFSLGVQIFQGDPNISEIHGPGV